MSRVLNGPRRLIYHRADALAPDRSPGAVAPSIDALDGRWVLAVRAREQMNGAILSGSARQRLLRLGGVLGLNRFEANLVLAIVQDAARRGRKLSDVADLLGRVPLSGSDQQLQPAKRVGWWVAAALIVEGLLIAALAI